MSEPRSLFSERSQRAIMWWGIGLAVVYTLALIFLLQQVPLKNPAWSAEQVAAWYADNQGKIKWGAVICGWAGAFMMPILAVVAIQMARVEGGWRIWSALSLVSGAMMSHRWRYSSTLRWALAHAARGASMSTNKRTQL